MKISKDYLRQVIRECMNDVMMGQTAGNYAPAVMPSSPMQMPMKNADPDGYEGRMAKGNLFKMAEYATQLHGMIQDGENLEPWVEEKIAVAASMLDSVAHYLQYNKMRGPEQGE